MRRRDYLYAVGLMALGLPLGALAQQSAKKPVIGLLTPNTAVLDGPRVSALVKRLGELGWTEGGNTVIHYRYADGRSEHLAEFASELVKLKVDVIITSATLPTLAAKNATSSIPIVFASVGDPIGAGLVASLARPGGNVTGLSLQMSDTASKRLGILREIMPGLHRVAILANADNASVQLDMREAQAAASALGIESIKTEVRSAEDIATAINALDGRAEAIYVCNDPLVTTNRARIGELALTSGLATVCGAREYVEAGNLISYGTDFLDLFHRTAELVDKILRGAKPGDLPVQQPVKFDLVINLRSAKRLGLVIPSRMIALADEVIE